VKEHLFDLIEYPRDILRGGCWIWRGSVTTDGHPIWNGQSAARCLWNKICAPILETGQYLDLCPASRLCVSPHHMNLVTCLEDRIRHKIIEHEDGCWGWRGAVASGGYPLIDEDGTTRRVSRLWWTIIHKKPIPEGLYVLHHCDTPWCLRPEHLWLGTPKDNMRDMISKGRSPRQRRQQQVWLDIMGELFPGKPVMHGTDDIYDLISRS